MFLLKTLFPENAMEKSLKGRLAELEKQYADLKKENQQLRLEITRLSELFDRTITPVEENFKKESSHTVPLIIIDGLKWFGLLTLTGDDKAKEGDVIT